MISRVLWVIVPRRNSVVLQVTVFPLLCHNIIFKGPLFLSGR